MDFDETNTAKMNGKMMPRTKYRSIEAMRTIKTYI